MLTGASLEKMQNTQGFQIQGRYQLFQLMGARFSTSHWDFQMMGTNYLLSIVVNKNWWE